MIVSFRDSVQNPKRVLRVSLLNKKTTDMGV
jgi:hypothetical protein